MIQYNEVKISRILNPTSIDLGEYVINPAKGCEFACLYCYVRSNKTTSREQRAWGSYVDVRINAAEQLEKEIALKKPRSVLLGSTTECFQPIEKQCGLMREILRVLNKHGVFYSILTRSPLIVEFIPCLNKVFCKKIYFTFNTMRDDLKSAFEPKSPAFEQRFKAIDVLLAHKISVIPYFSPVFPWISDFKGVFQRFSSVSRIEFEGLNFNLINIEDIIRALGAVYPELKDKYTRLLSDKDFYEATWELIRREIVYEAIKAKKSYNIYIHRFGDYFKNQYTDNRR